MAKRNPAYFLLIVAALWTGAATAGPKDGFGLNGGLASHSMDATFKPAFGGGTVSYDSAGISLGIDYQVALGDSLSLNPFLMTSGESASDELAAGTSAGHGILGLQLRYWIGDIFVGGHLAAYSEALSNSGTSTSANGGGVGLVVGWEDPKGGLFFMGQLDSATVEYNDADVDVSGVRLSVGYRWK